MKLRVARAQIGDQLGGAHLHVLALRGIGQQLDRAVLPLVAVDTGVVVEEDVGRRLLRRPESRRPDLGLRVVQQRRVQLVAQLREDGARDRSERSAIRSRRRGSMKMEGSG